ncbi:MAG: ATP-binding protein [Marmoricola sp.]
MRTLPIRVRLTLGFAAVAGLMLVVFLVFAYSRLANGFSDDLDRELRQRAQDLSGALARPDNSLAVIGGAGLIERGESFAQVQSYDGSALQSTSSLRHNPILGARTLSRVSSPTYVDVPHVTGLDEPARLLVVPMRLRGQRVALVVGDTRENGIEALVRIRRDMLVGGPLVLLVLAGLAYLLAGSALRPVEAMRSRAAQLSGGTPGQRLPLPPAPDEIARLGTTINALLSRVDLAVEQEKRFVANASHELRTPLALLRMELELATRRPRSARELVAAISSATDEVDRLSRLADNLLVLARSTDGAVPLAPERLLLADLFTDAASRFSLSGVAAGRTIRAEPGDVEAVVADPMQMGHALRNLLDNALRHGNGDVVIRAHESAGFVDIHVTDQGPGLDPELLARVFERFARSRTSRGSGLGLAIVAAVALAHGGRTGAGNRAGGGADVWLSLPSEA